MQSIKNGLTGAPSHLSYQWWKIKFTCYILYFLSLVLSIGTLLNEVNILTISTFEMAHLAMTCSPFSSFSPAEGRWLLPLIFWSWYQGRPLPPTYRLWKHLPFYEWYGKCKLILYRKFIYIKFAVYYFFLLLNGWPLRDFLFECKDESISKG